MSGCSQLDKDATHIIEEVLPELVEVLLLVQVTVHPLKVFPMMYSSCLDAPGLIKVRHVFIEVLLLILVGVDLDVPVSVHLEELLKIVLEVSSVAH